MNVQDAIQQLGSVLAKEGQIRYCLPCHKAVLFVRLLGARKPIRFTTGDGVTFRFDTLTLTVEDLRTHAIRHAYPWNRIVSVVAGEPESDNRDLFQG
jgi:hypothetical protein